MPATARTLVLVLCILADPARSAVGEEQVELPLAAGSVATSSDERPGFLRRFFRGRSSLLLEDAPVPGESLPIDAPMAGPGKSESIPIAGPSADDSSQMETTASESGERQPPAKKTIEERLLELEEEMKKDKEEEKKKKEAELRRPNVKWTGELQNDYAFFGQTTLNRAQVGDIQDGADFRRARFGMYGDFLRTADYRIEVDFALAGRPSFLDVWAGVHDVPLVNNLRVGRFFEPFSLERLTANRFLTFMERSVQDVFAPKRNVGAMAWNNWGYDERGTWAAGVFRSGTDDFGGDVGDRDGWAGTTRITYLVYYDEATEGKSLWHVGSGYSYRALTNRTLQFRERPEIRMARFGGSDVPFFVDTGVFPASHYNLVNFETAFVLHRFSMQAEYTCAPVAPIAGQAPYFEGAYVYASIFLTPDHRVYRRGLDVLRRFEAVFDRMDPSTYVLKPVGEPGKPRGIGAWELAARWSTLNLTSAGIGGGRLDDITLGINWYLNPFAKVQINYIRPILDDATSGNSSADIAAFRFQFEF